MGKLVFGLRNISKQGVNLMTKIKKSMIFLLCVFTAFLAVAICGCADDKDKKYDVAIRVGCSDGNVYEFPVGEDEKHITIPYDGIERTYWVDSYNLPDHPRYGDDWFSPSGEGANVFDSSLGKVHQKYDEKPPEYVCEKGEYFYSVHADSTANLWNFRTIYLYITVV